MHVGTSSTPRDPSAAAPAHNRRLAEYIRELETPHYDHKIPSVRDMLLRKLDRALDRLKEYPSKIETAEQALDAGIEGIGAKRSNLVRFSFNFILFSLFCS